MNSGARTNLGLTALLTAALATILMAGCAKTAIKQTWKSPALTGVPFEKIAIISVDNRGLVRQGFENRFYLAFKQNGQPSITTYDVMGLPEMKSDKTNAVMTIKGTGADAVLITRLVDQVTYANQVRATGERYAETVTGLGSYYGWYDYYSLAFMDLSTVWSSSIQEVFLDTTLYSLKDGTRVWSALTKTTIKETTDRLEEADAVTAMLAAAMRKDGVIR